MPGSACRAPGRRSRVQLSGTAGRASAAPLTAPCPCSKLFRRLAFLVLLSALSSSPAWTAQPALVSAAEPAYPPLSFADAEGHATGFAVELACAAVQAMGHEVEFSVQSWATLKQALAADRLDLLPLVGRTPERNTLFDFTVPYLSLYGGIVLRRDTQGIDSLDDLRGKPIGVMVGDNAEEYLRRQGFAESLITTPTFVEALALLKAGDVVAVVMQEVVARRLIDDLGMTGLRVGPRLTDFRQDFTIAVTEGDATLLAMLNEGLSRVVADGTYARLLETWLDPYQRLPLRERVNLPLITAIMVGLALLFAVLTYWNRRLVWEINERQRAEAAIRDTHLQLQRAVQSSQVGLWDWDLQTGAVLYSPEWKSQIGYAEQEVGDGLEEWQDRVHPDDLDAALAHIERMLEQRSTHDQIEFRFRHKDGSYLWILSQAGVLTDEAGNPIRVLGSHIDITARKEAETALRQAASVFESTTEMIVITDAHANILRVNPAFSQVYGYSAAEVLGQNPRLLKSGQHDRAFYERMWAVLAEAGQWQGRFWNRCKDGRVIPIWQRITAVPTAQGDVDHYVAVGTDLSQLEEQEVALKFLLYHDPLTRLINRNLFLEQLNRAVARRQRQAQELAVLLLDLDRFRQVNETFGHSVGDQVLLRIVGRLRQQLRATDTLARLAGDEFAVLLEDVHEPAQVQRVVEKLIAAMSHPFALDGEEVYITLSIGIAVTPEGGEEANILLKHADMALQRSKSQGRGSHFVYSPVMATAHHSQFDLYLYTWMRKALDREQFWLAYQPQVDLLTGQVIGCEALIRWQHPERGLMNPGEFIPFAEQTGLILQLGEWVLLEACRQMQQWREAGWPLSTMAVNVAGLQLQSEDLPIADIVTKALGQSELPPAYLEIEVTETAIMDHDDANAVLMALKSLGVSLALDDFGTGHSSLERLKHLPLDKLKIDRSFIRDLPDEPNDAAITRAVISLARSLELEVLAEGVETAAHCAFLVNEGCGKGQGYYFSPPLDASGFEAWCEGDDASPRPAPAGSG